MLLDFDNVIKETYEFELTRKEQLNSNLSISLGVMTVLAGFAYSLSLAIKIPFSTIEIIILNSLVLFFTVFTYSAYLLYKAHVGNLYSAVADAKALSDYQKKLQEWAKEDGKNDPVAQFQQHIRNLWVNSAKKNADVNKYREDLIFRYKKMIAFSLFLLVHSALIRIIESILTI